VNSLDELFGEALDHAAMPTTQERRAAVAEVTVHGARRKRRMRAMSEAIGTLAVAGVAVAGVALAVANNDAGPANPQPSLSPDQPAPSPSPVVTAFSAEDASMPLEPPMTADDWASLDSSWDVEFAAMTNPGDEGGSSAQLYLTPPGGERKFAYGYPRFDLTAPILLAYQPGKFQALVYDGDTKTLNSVDFATGAVTQIANMLGTPIERAWPLGRAQDGSAVFAMETTDAEGRAEITVYVYSEDSAQGVSGGWSAVGPVWGNRFVAKRDGTTYAVDVTGRTSTHEFTAVPQDCDFTAWTLAGTFVVECGATDTEAGTLLAIDPATGAQEDLGPARFAPDDPVAAVMAEHAIDSTRWWQGDGTSGRKIFPPAVYAGEELAILSTGFIAPPDSYAVIFGIRD